MNKKCSKCKEIKDISMFYKNKQKKDNLQSNCKKCHTITCKDYIARNPEKYKEWNKKQMTKKRAYQSKMRSRKLRKDMTNSYLKDLITMNNTDLKPKDIPNELAELWKINLTLKRELKLTKKLKKS
jgi:hypothetical protein